MSNPPQGLLAYPTVEDYVHRGSLSGLTLWYCGAANQTTFGTAALTFDQIFAYPVVLPGGVIDTVAFEVTTVGGAGSKARAGIYRNTSELVMYPSTLVVDAGEFACDAAATVKSTSGLSVAVEAGLYWFVLTAGVASPTVRSINPAAINHVLGALPAMGANYPTILNANRPYAALSATFAAGAAATAGGNNGRLVAIHMAS